MEQWKNIYLIFKEVINNVFKYAGCSEIHVDLRLKHNMLQMDIRDNGVGFDAENPGADQKMTLSGNGLENIRSRAKEMNGQVRIDSKPGVGTVIILTVNIP